MKILVNITVGSGKLIYLSLSFWIFMKLSTAVNRTFIYCEV
jgi:hypothetical protein